MPRALLLLSSCLLSFTLLAQDYELKSTVEIYGDLQKLHRGMRVLYLAAHPDDENTRLISWLENSANIETAYLSLTRGQGGQNLIGDEKGDGLGVIRTHELLEARRTDGGQQYFTRAVDFGYSKSAEESFEKWGREEVLSDVVYVIRTFRPHVIVTRFPPTRRAGHGHHEASAILAEEAFDLAGDPTAFPEQIGPVGQQGKVRPWQVISLYHNESTWWDKTLEGYDAEQLQEKKIHKVNIGVFSELRGMGINEIASLARSKHRCQAFGTSRDRGERFEYLRLVKGDWVENFPDFYPGVWNLSPEHQEALALVIEGFDFTDRSKNLKLLDQHFAHKIAQRNVWAEGADMRYVMDAYNQLRLDLLGVRVEAYAGKDPVAVNTDYEVNFEVFNSGSEPFEITFSGSAEDTAFKVEGGKRVNWTRTMRAPNDASTPYWLREPHGNLYVLEDRQHLGMPVLDDQQIPFTIKSAGVVVTSSTELHRRWTDRSYGEFTQPMVFVPHLHINPDQSSLIVPVGESAEVKVKVRANRDIDYKMLNASISEGWKISKTQEEIALAKGQEVELSFIVTPEKGASPAMLDFSVQMLDTVLNQSAQWIRYDHIPERIIHVPASVKLVPVDLPKVSGRILYVDGSGDEVDEALQLMGYEVDKRSLAGLTVDQLKNYKAVVLGIRALNRNDELKSYHRMLLDYARNGGNLVVQYNTTYDLSIDPIGPYPMTLSRKRVTEEDSEVNLLIPDHAVFNAPNKINPTDFDGWVQERGLYFAGTWDEENYTPLIAWHDKGEDDVNGGLLVANTGSGSFFYTGISFFRELPAGVPGAYRLLMNIIEYQP